MLAPADAKYLFLSGHIEADRATHYPLDQPLQCLQRATCPHCGKSVVAVKGACEGCFHCPTCGGPVSLEVSEG